MSATRLVVKWTSGEPFQVYFSEILAQQAQKELEASKGPFDLKVFQTNLERTVLHVHPKDMVIFSKELNQPNQTNETTEFEQALTAQKVNWQALETTPFDTTTMAWRQASWRVVRVLHNSHKLYIGVNAEAFKKPVDQILAARDQVVVKIFPILIFIVLFTTALILYVVLKPIQNLQNTFKRIKISSAHEHLETKGNFSEFVTFIQYFNELIDRLRASYTQAARFSSDAAHELRTPLTIIRGHLHRLINQVPDGSTTQVELSVLSDEVERLISISNKLLFLSQADAGQIGLQKEDVNLADLVGQMMDDIKSDRPDLVLTKEIEGAILIKADRDLIYQLMTNLFGNAIKYNHNKGSINFEAHVIRRHVHFSISNTTKLASSGLDDRVFERFYRHLRVEGEGHEEGAISGAGLGLSLCKEIVKVHGGDLHLTVTPDRKVCIEGRLSVTA